MSDAIVWKNKLYNCTTKQLAILTSGEVADSCRRLFASQGFNSLNKSDSVLLINYVFYKYIFYYYLMNK